jgi:hypothetical protein
LSISIKRKRRKREKNCQRTRLLSLD